MTTEKSFDFKAGLSLVALIAGLLSPFIAVQIATAVGSEKMRQMDETNKSQWSGIKENSKEIIDIKLAVAGIQGDMKVLAAEQKSISGGQTTMIGVLEELRKDLARKPGR